MHNRCVVLTVIFLMAFCCMGCSSSPAKPAPPAPPTITNILYNFAEDDNYDETAIIIIHSVSDSSSRSIFRLIDIDGIELPAPEENTRWNPVQVPAGSALNISMYVLFRGDQPGHRRLGVFRCPPLEAGKIYRLWYEMDSPRANFRNASMFTGAGRLILTYSDVERLTYDTPFLSNKRIPTYHQIYVQEIPPLTKGIPK